MNPNLHIITSYLSWQGLKLYIIISLGSLSRFQLPVRRLYKNDSKKMSIFQFDFWKIILSPFWIYFLGNVGRCSILLTNYISNIKNSGKPWKRRLEFSVLLPFRNISLALARNSLILLPVLKVIFLNLFKFHSISHFFKFNLFLKFSSPWRIVLLNFEWGRDVSLF